MHDIDRTYLETGWDGSEYEPEYESEYEGEWEFDGSPEMYGEAEEPYGEYFEDTFGEVDGYGEYYGEAEEPYGEYYGEIGDEGPFSEAEEMELAFELLGVGSEQELDQFLGKLFSKIGRGVKKFARSSVGRALGGALKGIAKKALPVVGGALGSFIPIPGVGTAVGTALGSAAGRMFGLELEGLSPEDQEFEVARRFVRLAGEAARNATMAPPSVPPQQVAKQAIAAAATAHAPGLAVAMRRPGPKGRGRSGRWIRRGRTIILLGA
jgi:uncharacterized protein (DUF697 family)